ncbi:sensor histidine kinase [Paucibacter oligotrophus]|uniref:histidine kinase n=1 Tax=Roseateles oligotrophus TaxID=1769250 RepID=A0ABT2YEB2_9BURK|nr:sensor histidine kinase [Roseateles oligotrophus]
MLALLAVILLGCGLAFYTPARAQAMSLPEAPAQHAGEQAQAAELALSAWSRSELDAWWAALRAMDGAADKRGGLPAHLQPPEDPKAWATVALPDLSGRGASAGGIKAEPAVQMRWYRFRYAPEQGRWPTSVALYMPRLVSMAAAVLVRSNEGWQPIFDNQAGAREQWVRPLWVVFPAALTELRQHQMIDVVVAVPVATGAAFSVSTAWLGAREDVETRFQRRWWLQIGVPQATGLTLIALGLFSLSLWVRRRDEPAFLLFAILSAAWWVRNLHYHLELPRKALGLEWFWWLTNASMSWVMLLIFLFALRFAHRRFELLERCMVGFVLISGLLTLPWWNEVLGSSLLQHGANALVGTLAVLFVMRLAWSEGSRELRMIALSLMLSLLLGMHDLTLLAGAAWPEHIYLMPYATLLTLASFLYAVQRRYTGALSEVELLNRQLGERLQLQSTELQAQYERLREAERQQALLIERQRLMQDMHDGLGSSLLSAMVAVEQGSMDQDKVVEVLRECVDDLRLVIDSLEPVAHDLVALLATMRYRLGKRLQAGGLMLEWDVQDLPLLEWLEPPDALHVLRLMQEALSNVLKHARATRVRMVTRNHSRYVEIRVEDDGDGFDIATAQMGRGLKSQQRRALRLGGSLRIDSSLGHGTRLSLRLPVSREEAPGQQKPS